MSGSVEIATWIHEYELRALEKYLAMEGTDTEQVMQKMLAELYSDRVPLEERQAIQKRIETERAEQLARQMANTTWTAYHVTGHGVERYFKTATADQLLHTAMRLRTYLSEEANPHPDSFVGRFRNQQPITKEEFDQMVAQRLEKGLLQNRPKKKRQAGQPEKGCLACLFALGLVCEHKTKARPV